MPRKNEDPGLKFELVGCVATFYDKDDVLRAKKDALGDNPGEDAFEVHAPFGEILRPRDAERDTEGQPRADRMCTMLVGVDGDEQHAWMCEDPRIIAKMPRAKQDERILHGYGAQFIRFHADGTLTLWTSTTNEPDGQGISLQIGPTGLRFVSPFGKVTFDANGFVVRDRSGARLALGGCSAPSPLDALASYALLSAGMVSIEGSAVSQGTDGGTANELGVVALLSVIAQFVAVFQSMGQSGAAVDPLRLAAIANIGKVA